VPNISSKACVSFSKAGGTILSETFAPKSTVYEYFCQYDKKGNLVQMNIRNIFGNDFMHSAVYRHKYDNKGRTIETIAKYDNAMDSAKTIYKYMPGKQIIEQINDKNFYEKTKIDTLPWSLTNRDFSKFNYKKRLVFKERDTVFGKKYNEILIFDKNMNKVEAYDYLSFDSLISSTFYEYDLRNNLICAKTYQLTNLIRKTTHSYVYDNAGNWTTDSIFKMDSLSHIITRKFEYYH
jgi:hypothetical protein